MKKLRSIVRKFWLLAPVGVIAWLIFGVYRPFEPHYLGRSLSYWARGVTSPYAFPNYHNPVNDLRVDAIRHIGTNALPYAIRFCSRREFGWNLKIYNWLVYRRAYGESFGKSGLLGYEHLETIIHTANDTRNEGIGICAALGPMAKPIIPDLIKLLGDKNGNVGMAACNSLMTIGPDAIPQLIVAMTNQDEAVRDRAVFSLKYMIDTTGDLQTAIRPAIPVLVALLNDEMINPRIRAAQTLGKYHQDASLVVPALIEALKRESNFNRQTVDSQQAMYFREDSLRYIDAIGAFSTNAQVTVPYLVETIRSDSALGKAALDALRHVAPETAESYIQKFNEALTNPPPDSLVSNLYYNYYGIGNLPNKWNRMPSALPTSAK